MAYNPMPPLGQAANAASLPVTLSTEQNAYLDGIEGLLTTIDGRVDGIEALIGTTNTTLTTIDGRVDGIEALLTSIEGDTSAIQTAVQLLDDAAVVLGTATYTETTSVGLAIGAVRRDADTTLVNTTNEWGPLQMDANGRLKVEAFSGETLPVSFTGSGDVATQTTLASLLTSSQLIDDSIFTAGTDTYTEATSKGQLMLAVRRDADTTLANTTNEFTALQVDANGYLKVEVFSGGQNIPVSAASGAFASGSIASGAIASGAIASGAIAAGAIAAGATSIATTEDTASAAADHLVKVAQIRLDTPVSGANLSNSGDYTQFIADSFGKTWTAGSYPEDIAHIAGEAILGNGSRRIDTAASSAGTSGDWATVDSSAEGALWTTLTPTTTSGLTIFRSLDLDETEEEIKATGGNVYGYYFYNASASLRYLKWYNATAANVTVGSTTPVITMPVPPTTAGHVTLPVPVTFATAITVAVTTALADADTGAPSANDFILNVFYK